MDNFYLFCLLEMLFYSQTLRCGVSFNQNCAPWVHPSGKCCIVAELFYKAIELFCKTELLCDTA